MSKHSLTTAPPCYTYTKETPDCDIIAPDCCIETIYLAYRFLKDGYEKKVLKSGAIIADVDDLNTN